MKREEIKTADFVVNRAGAKIYMDVSKHEVLKIPVLMNDKTKGVVHEVLSVGVVGAQRALIATIKKSNKNVVAYRLPEELRGWAEHSMGMSAMGVKFFPTKVEFGILNGRTYAEVL